MPTAYNRGQRAAPKAPPPDGVDLSGGTSQPMKGSYGSPTDEFLYGPTARPMEPVTTGATAKVAPPPESVQTWLPHLIAMARRPDAPPELVHLVDQILEATNQ